MYKASMLTNVLEYIEQNLCEELTVETIAESCFYSESGLQKLFGYVFHYSIKDYIIKRRMTWAAYDLINSPQSGILDVAMKYGYRSNEAFTRAFKQFWKCTPSAFRSQQRFTGIMPQLMIPSEDEDDYTKTRSHMNISQLYDLYQNRQSCYFICCGIHSLATINKLSYKIGDAAILEAANRIDQACSTEDIIYRIGGDEFAILTNSEDIQYAQDIVGRISKMNGSRIPYEAMDVPLYLYTNITKLSEISMNAGKLFEWLHKSVKESKVGKIKVLEAEGRVQLIGRKIGEGAASDVYEYGTDRVVKLYRPDCSAALLRYEYEKMKRAGQFNLPVPKADEIIEYQGQFGYIMERVPGVTLQSILYRYYIQVCEGSLSIEKYAEVLERYIIMTAQCLYQIHRVQCDCFISAEILVKQILHQSLLLSDEEKKIIERKIDELPSGTCLCHGDPNPFNILVHGEHMQMVDWANASVSSPMIDIAEYALLSRDYQYGDSREPKEFREFRKTLPNRILSVFLTEYERLSGTDVSGYEAYFLPLLVIKLNSSERTLEVKTDILREIRERMKNN